MACDYSDVLDDLVWQVFLKQLRKMIARRFGRKAAAALAARSRMGRSRSATSLR